MTANRLAYVVALTSDPSQISHPAGTEPTVTPLHMNTAPVGRIERGGYGALLILLRMILLTFMLGDAIEFNETIVLFACRFVVNTVGDSKVVVWMFVVDTLGDVTRLDASRLFVKIEGASKRGTLIVLSACIVDVVMKFILAVRELNWKHPMLLAVVV
jgi:hypothetical protein